MYALLVAESMSPHPAGLALIEPQDARLLTLIGWQADEQINRPPDLGAALRFLGSACEDN